jgi:hypothetical protein
MRRPRKLGIEVTFITARGDPYTELSRVAGAFRADAVIVGASAKAGHVGVDHFLAPGAPRCRSTGKGRSPGDEGGADGGDEPGFMLWPLPLPLPLPLAAAAGRCRWPLPLPPPQMLPRVVDSPAVGSQVGGADEFAARAPSYVCRAGSLLRKQWS